MKRRIVLLGKATNVVSLPTRWVREHGLGKGDYIDMAESDSRLIISTETFEPRTEVRIDLKDYGERTIRNILNQTYRKGFDVLRLVYSTDEQYDLLRDIARHTMLGFEIVEERKKLVVIENIVEPTEEKFDSVLRKLFLTIKSEFSEMDEDLASGKLNLKRRKDVKDTVDNYTNFLRRMVIKYKTRGSRESYLLFYMISQMSLVHHAYFYMYKKLDETKHRLDKDMVGLVREASAMFPVFYDAFYKNDMDLAHQLQMTKKKLLKKVKDMLEKRKGIDNVALYHIGELIRLTQMSSTVLFGFVEGQECFV